FSRLAGEKAGQARARYYLTVVRYVSWITLPIAAATILFAPEFVMALYGETWAPVILPLQLLAGYGLIRSIAANMGSIFRAMGKPQWLTYIAAWRLTTMLVFLYPVTMRWGIAGVSALSLVVAVVDFVISASLVGRLVTAPWFVYAGLLWLTDRELRVTIQKGIQQARRLLSQRPVASAAIMETPQVGNGE
ncbi:MAG: hypothetical protein CVU38_00345, partial [Chloroflexi bacterium HGW-Chloroflexi-1]